MHPILIQLVPQYAAILGALVALLWAGSHWMSYEKDKRTTGRLVVMGAIAAVVGAAAGWFIVSYFFVNATPPKPAPKIHTFGPLVALGSFLGILYIRREGARRNFDPELLTGLAVETLLVGVAGSRVMFILITPESFVHDPRQSPIFNWVIQYVALWNGGLVWYGGLLPAALFAPWRAKNLGLPWRTVTDIFAPAVFLGLGVGRIGCLMAGDDHGKLVESGPHWWTLTFPVNDKDGNPETLVSKELQGKPLWPSQPMMAIGDFIIVFICHMLQKRWQNRPTAVMFLMMSLYSILRFFIEFIRGDIVRKFLIPFETKRVFDPINNTMTEVATSGLSTSQAISIPLGVAMLIGLIYVLTRPPRGIEQPRPDAMLHKPEAPPPPADAPPQAAPQPPPQEPASAAPGAGAPPA